MYSGILHFIALYNEQYSYIPPDKKQVKLISRSSSRYLETTIWKESYNKNYCFWNRNGRKH
jgi:hypothetical protein